VIQALCYTVFTGAIIKGAYTTAFETSGAAIDDPDVVLYEKFKCESIGNYNKYCNREVEAKIDEQSSTLDTVKRKQRCRRSMCFCNRKPPRWPSTIPPVPRAGSRMSRVT
jgi:hypothetical protein